MKTLTTIIIGATALCIQTASATLLESWENNLGTWTIQQGAYSSSFSTSSGVTDGTYSLALTGTASPTYGQMLRSAFDASYTSILGGATNLSFDIFAPSASFGFFLQFDVDINNADTGFVSLDGFSYPSTTIGAETTITVPISTSLAAILAASVNPTQIIIQVGGGFTTDNETFYIDNLRAGVTPVPEPTVAALAGFGLAGLLALRRRLS